MLGKVLKYDIKRNMPLLLIFIGILIVTTFSCVVFVLSFTSERQLMAISENKSSIVVTIVGVMVFLTYYMSIFALMIGVGITVASTFYKSMYTSEGYLTHSLPVSKADIFNAKYIAGIIQVIFTYIMMAISVFMVLFSVILLMIKLEMTDVVEITVQLEDLINQVFRFGSKELIIYIFMAFIITPLYMVSSIYAAISIGQIFNKHKLLGAIGVYFGINTIVEIVLGAVYLRQLLVMNIYTIEHDGNFLPNNYMYTQLGAYLVLAIVFYILSRWILDKKLNLE